MEGGTADSEPRGHGCRHGPLEVCDALGPHDAADVVGAGLLEGAHRNGDIVAGDDRVAIYPHDDVVIGGSDRRIESGCRAPGRIGHRAHAVIASGQPCGNVMGRILRGAQGQDHLHGAGVLRVEDRAHRLREVGFLVEYGHHHGDSRPCADFRPCARALSHVRKGSLGA